MPKQLFYHRIKHGSPHKLQELHLALTAVATEAVIKPSREDRAHLSEVRRYQTTLDDVVDGRVAAEERLTRQTGCGSSRDNNYRCHGPRVL